MNKNTPIQEIWSLKTKLIPPKSQGDLIARDTLIHTLERSVKLMPVTLISAPAGYGKTTLITSLYNDQGGLPIAWLSLDEDDNDPSRFFIDLMAALQQAVPGCVDTAKRLFASFSNPANETKRLMGVLINDLLQIEADSLILILDDLHIVTIRETLELLTYLIGHLPAKLHVVLSTRSDPALPLPLLRSRGNLAEYRLTNLRFSQEEVQMFLSQLLKVELSQESIKILESRIEGWVAVLRLLGASLRKFSTSQERDSFIRSLPTSDHHIFEFLAEEVLNQQEPLHRKFLLETSILHDLRYDTCQEVTGQMNASKTLDLLFKNNLLQIVPLDESESYTSIYRYHDLMKAFLLNQLNLEYTVEEIQQLHCRAAEAQPETEAAVYHYIYAKQWDQAATLIQQIGQQLIFTGFYDTVNHWIEKLPRRTIEQFPQLQYFLGVTAFQRGEFEKAQELVSIALEGFKIQGDQTRIGEAVLILGAIASGYHDTQRGAILLEEALSYPLSTQMQIMARINRAWVGVYSNNWDMVSKDVNTAIQLALSLEDPSAFNVLAPHLTAVLLFMPDGIERLKAYSDRVLAWFGGDVSLIRVGANALLGVIHIAEGNLTDGYQALKTARQDSDQLGGFVWLDIGIDFGLLQYAIMKSNYREFDTYWNSRLPYYEQVSGAREYLSTFLYIKGRAMCYQGNYTKAQEVYSRMLEIEEPDDIPESQLSRALMGALLSIHQQQYHQAESILHQIAALQRQAPHSVLFGDARLMLVTLYQKMGRPEDALLELGKLISEYERKNMLGLLLNEGDNLELVLQLAADKGIYPQQVNWLLGNIGKDDKFQPMFIHHTGETISKRESEVLYLISTGMTNREIADSMVISETTVKSHITSVFRKLNVRTRTQAAAKARSLNLF